jgi:erythromycin esterase
MTSLLRLLAFSLAVAFLLLGSFGCTSEERAIQPVPPDAPDRFDKIADALDGQRVVLLGESSHGVADFYERKAALVRYLHEEHDYDVLVFESGLADVALQYDRAERTDAKTLIREALLYDTERLVPLMDYIKASKTTDDPLHLAGIDLQSTGYAGAVGSLVNDSVDTRFLSTLRGRLWQCLFENRLSDYNRLSRRFTANADTLLRILDRDVPPDSRSYLEQALVRNVRNARTFFSFKYETDRAAGFPQMQALRDSIMAENLFWLTNSVFPEKKVIVWAHNGHIMNDNFEERRDLGEYVHARMPDASYALGVVAHRGTAFEQHQDRDTIQFRHAGPDAMEARLAEPGFSEAFVDFTTSPRPSWADDSLTVAHNTTHSKRIVPSAAFDGVYFIDRVTFENVLQMD